jgi:tetratricopeptide (TPR) repeat protein
MIVRLLFALGCFAAAVFAAAQATAVAPPWLDVRPLALALDAAHAPNPRDTNVSLQLGLQLERAGDFAQAEKILLKAARYDHQYQPAWTLTNYYFRRGRRDQFWQWAQRAAELSYDDGRPLLRLATALEDDSWIVMDRLGRKPVFLRTYLDMLIAEDRRDAARQVAAKLAELHDPADEPRFEALRKRYEGAK